MLSFANWWTGEFCSGWVGFRLRSTNCQQFDWQLCGCGLCGTVDCAKQHLTVVLVVVVCDTVKASELKTTHGHLMLPQQHLHRNGLACLWESPFFGLFDSPSWLAGVAVVFSFTLMNSSPTCIVFVLFTNFLRRKPPAAGGCCNAVSTLSLCPLY